MATQLTLNFNGFALETFEKVKKAHSLQEIKSLEEKIRDLTYSLRAYKGHTTKRKQSKKQ